MIGKDSQYEDVVVDFRVIGERKQQRQVQAQRHDITNIAMRLSNAN